MTYQEVQNLMLAADLVRLGARTGVVEHLTGLPSSRVRRLIRDITGCRPVSGQLPYTPTWYEERPERLVHCAVFLRLYAAESTSATQSAAAAFLRAYIRYTETVKLLTAAWQNEQLNINRAHLATQLSRIGELSHRSCADCACRFVEVRSVLAKKCQVCRNKFANALTEGRTLLSTASVVA